MIRFIFTFIVLIPIAASAAAIGDVVKGESIAGQVCVACHGTDGNSPLPMNPVLAGQHPEYLYKQLTNFKSGDRKNAVMSAMVANLSDTDMRDLAAFYASQKPKSTAANDKDLVARGQEIYRGGIADNSAAACAGCHSPNGAGIPVQYPRLAGQHAQYTSLQLQAFRTGDRNNDPNGMMQVVASKLSDKDIAALAEYISGLR